MGEGVVVVVVVLVVVVVVDLVVAVVVVVVVVVVVAGGGQAGGWYPLGGSSPPGRAVERDAIKYPCPAGHGGGVGAGVGAGPLGCGYPFSLPGLSIFSVLSMYSLPVPLKPHPGALPCGSPNTTPTQSRRRGDGVIMPRVEISLSRWP